MDDPAGGDTGGFIALFLPLAARWRGAGVGVADVDDERQPGQAQGQAAGQQKHTFLHLLLP